LGNVILTKNKARNIILYRSNYWTFYCRSRHQLTVSIRLLLSTCLCVYLLRIENILHKFACYHNLAGSIGSNNARHLNRFCFTCRLEIEDQFNFVLKCPLYSDLIKQYIKPYSKKPGANPGFLISGGADIEMFFGG